MEASSTATDLRHIHGAIRVVRDQPEHILRATAALLTAMIEANGVRPEEIASILFLTSRLSSAFPAQAARKLGWTRVPLLDIDARADGDFPRNAIVIDIAWNATPAHAPTRHVALGAGCKRYVCLWEYLAEVEPLAAAR